MTKLNLLENKLSEEIDLANLNFKVYSVNICSKQTNVYYEITLNQAITIYACYCDIPEFSASLEDMQIFENVLDFEKELLNIWFENYNFSDLLEYVEIKYESEINDHINEEMQYLNDESLLLKDPYKYYGVNKKDFY